MFDPDAIVVVCDYCGAEAVLVGGDVIYPNRPDLGDSKYWHCAPCGAYVGTHRNSSRHAPLGRLANAELRGWKRRAHAAFDPLWQRKMARDGCSKSEARTAGYEWLAGELGLTETGRDCHIGMFDVETCRKVVAICRAYHKPV